MNYEASLLHWSAMNVRLKLSGWCFTTPATQDPKINSAFVQGNFQALTTCHEVKQRKWKWITGKVFCCSSLFSCCNIYVIEDLSQALISNSRVDQKQQHFMWLDKGPFSLTSSDLRQINMQINVFDSNKSALTSTEAEICLAEGLDKI